MKHYCAIRRVRKPARPADLQPGRARAIILMENKWLNGETLSYFFYHDRKKHGRTVKGKWKSWVGPAEQVAIVRKGFDAWKKLGIGLKFEEVETAKEADIRIGFEKGDDAWSFVGTEINGIGPRSRTMNYGWKLEGKYGASTAIHEVGHTLGLPHEHQNPFAGIVWDEEAVYEAFAGRPNYWSRRETFDNIISKIEPDDVQGSSWDPDSVMHYDFDRGLILEPAEFNKKGLKPKGGLSPRDRTWIHKFYPPLGASDLRVLEPLQSQFLDLTPGGQADFVFEPVASRSYTIQTIGPADTHLGLFEEVDGKTKRRAQDDDSGEARNAKLRVKLLKGARYVIRARLKHAEPDATPSILVS